MITRARCLDGEAARYMGEICALADAEAWDWRAHPCFDGRAEAFPMPEAGFRHAYDDGSA